MKRTHWALSMLVGAGLGWFGGCSSGSSDAERTESIARAGGDEARLASALLESAREQFTVREGGERRPMIADASDVEWTLHDGVPTAVHGAAADRSGLRRASITLPSSASGSVQLVDRASGLGVRFAAKHASSGARAEIVQGVVVYRGTFGEGRDSFLRVTPDGVEDFVRFAAAPPDSSLTYTLDVGDFAGLRLVANQLELLDAGGVPRLRVSAPYLVDARGRRHDARLRLRGCRIDESPAPPFGRAVTPPGARSCELKVDWSAAAAAVAYPILVDPAWTTTGKMGRSRRYHALARVKSGKVLAAGGEGGAGTSAYTAEVYDPATGVWAATSNLLQARGWALGVGLDDGRVLVAGGSSANVAELWDEATGTWANTGTQAYNTANGFQLLKLKDGRVLMAGGNLPGSGGGLNSAHVYDPATNSWTATTNKMNALRNGPAGAVLNDGRVLIAGGHDESSPATETADVYDPATNAWTATGSMAFGRAFAAAALLPSGEVLVAGGQKVAVTITASAELWSPTSGTWKSAASLSHKRTWPELVVLDDSRVLAIGGYWSVGVLGAEKMTERYDPAADTWTDAGNLVVDRGYLAHRSVKLTDGRVLVTGGGDVQDTAEIYARVANGGSCTLGSECQSGQCVAGMCCDKPCAGGCESCRASEKATGADGACGPIKTATDPKKACADCQACSASGACVAVALGTDPKNDCLDSGSPACSLNGLCNGSGACQSYSSASGCTPLACTAGKDCASGSCADGVCCDSACTGPCMACTAAKKGQGVDGQCGPTAADTDPDNECAEGVNYPTSCLSDGMCDGSGKCRVFAKDTVSCGATQCSQGAAEGLLCNGAGQCLTAKTSCEPYLCKNNACLSSCQSANDCVTSAFCNAAGSCTPKLVDGSVCGAGQECLNGYCVDGVCCKTACTGQCEACDVSPNEGTCVPVTGAPHSNRPACAGDSECGGSCDGVNTAACSYKATGTPCGTATCASGIAKASECNGQGTCSPLKDELCAPYTCDTDFCRTSCTSNDHCASGFICGATSACVPAPTSQCSTDLTKSTTGATEADCAPYLCNETTGSCRETCTATPDCAAGFVCDPGVRTCAKASSGDEPAEDSGCGCRTAGGKTPPAGLAALALLGLALARRRRARPHRS